MFWLLSLVGAFLVGALLVFLLGTVFGRGEALPPVTEGAAKRQHWDDLQNSPLTADGIRETSFSLAFRGYNQAEVDLYIERLAARIEELEGHSEQPAATEADASATKVDTSATTVNTAETLEQER